MSLVSDKQGFQLVLMSASAGQMDFVLLVMSVVGLQFDTVLIPD